MAEAGRPSSARPRGDAALAPFVLPGYVVHW